MLLVPLSTALHADDTWTGASSADWSSASNWTNNLPTTSYGTLTFSSAANSPTYDDIASTNQNELLDMAGAFAIKGTGSISLYDNGGTQAKIENNGAIGLFTLNMGTLNFAATTGAAWGEVNAVNGDITFGTANTLNVNGSQVAGIRLFGANYTTTFNNTVNASGKYFATTAAATNMTIGGTFASSNIYVMNNGVLNLATNGVINNDNNTGVRLGGDFGNTGTQNLAQSGTFNLTSINGGTTFAGVVNSVSGNTSGTLAVNSNDTGGTNSLSGHIALDSALAITQAAGGTLNITQARSGTTTTTGVDIKAQTLTLTPALGGTIATTGDVYNSGGRGNVTDNDKGSVILSSNIT